MVKKGRVSIVFLVLLLIPLVSAQTLQIGMINQDPDPVSAGDIVEVKFKIENFWETTKHEVIVEIQPEYPFTLYSGNAQQNVGVIRGNQKDGDAQVVEFKLKADANAVEGDHEIPILIRVGDTIWEYDDSFFIDIESEEIRFRSYIRNSDLVTAGSKGKFTIEFANAGGYDIEFLEMELLPSDDYKLLSTSTYTYIGELDSDDTESEEFHIYVPEDIEKVMIPISVTYEVNDYVYTSEETLQLELLNVEEATTIGLVKKSSAPAILMGVIIGLIILFFIKKRKK